MVRAGRRVGRQEAGAGHRDDARAAHARTGVGAHGPKATMVPASALRPAAAPDAAGHGDEPAPQSGARLLAGVSVHEDLATAHAGARPGVRSAQLTADGAPHDEPPAAHLRAGPVARVALDDELAVVHPRADVRPRAAGDRQAAAGHPCSQARDAPRSPTTRTSSAPVAGEGEQLAQRRGTVAVPELEPLDLAAAEAGQPVGAQRLGEDRRRRRLAQCQGERHGTSSRRWKWCGPRLPP